MVEELLNDFKAGRKDSEDFWIKFKDKYVYIRYFAVRDENGEYVGTLEFTQNIAPIKAIDGTFFSLGNKNITNFHIKMVNYKKIFLISEDRYD